MSLACARLAKFLRRFDVAVDERAFGAGKLRVRDLALLLIGHGELPVADRGERLLRQAGAEIGDRVVEQAVVAGGELARWPSMMRIRPVRGASATAWRSGAIASRGLPASSRIWPFSSWK